MASIIGALRVSLGLDSAEFAAGAAQAEATTTRLGTSLARLDRPVAQVQRGMGRMGGGLQNASFQLQDMVVQLQSGTKASTVLAQQLPQLAGGFGAFGAALGLVTGLSIPFLAGIVDMGAVLDAAGGSLGRLVAMLPSLGGAGNAITGALAAIAGNLDRIAIYGAAAAAIFAGRYVAGLAAAAVATGSLSGALLVLRGAIVRTGFGALVVGAGELVYQFLRLVDGAGGFGNALGLVANVGAAAFSDLGNMALGYGSVFAGMAAGMASDWTLALADMIDAFGQFVQGILDTKIEFPGWLQAIIPPGMANGPRVSLNVSPVSDGLRNRAGDFGVAAATLQNSGNQTIASADRTSAAVSALSDALANASGSAIDLSGALAGDDGDGKSGRGGRAGGAAGAAKAARDAVEEAMRNIVRATPPAVEEVVAFNAALQDAVDTASELGEKKAHVLISGIDGISDAFGDFVSGGLRDFKGFVNDILGSFQNMLSQMISIAVKNRIMISMGITGSGIAGPAAAGAAAAGIPVPAGATTGAATGILGGIGTAVSAFGSGFGGVASGLLSGGFAGAGSAISSAMAGATSSLAGFATAAGAIAAPLLAGVVLFKAFKGSTEKLDEGLRIVVDGLDRATVQTYETIKRTRFFGLSSNTSDHFDSASKAVAGPIEAAYKEIGGHILDLARTMGKGAKDFAGFSYDFKLSLDGMSDEEKVKAVTEKFAEVSDKLARMAGASKAFALDGETATQTLERMAASFGAVKNAYNLIFDVNLKAGESATKLATKMVQAAGGLDAFTQATDFYVKNFLSLPEQVGEASEAFRRGLRKLGITAAVETEDQFNALVDRLKANGRDKKLGGLLALADDFKALLDLQDQAAEPARRLAEQRTQMEARLLELQGNVGELRRRELEAMDASLRPLQQTIYAFEDLQKTLGLFNEEDFATRFDFLRAKGTAASGLYGGAAGTTGTGVPLYTVPPTPAPASAAAADTQAALLTEMRALRAEVAGQRQTILRIENNTGKAADSLDEAMIAGMPTVALKR